MLYNNLHIYAHYNNNPLRPSNTVLPAIMKNIKYKPSLFDEMTFYMIKHIITI